MKGATAELVRISDKGVAHPIGKIASRRMRDREGAFRMLPSPGHVVFMRYTGEDGRRDEEDGAIVRLAGEITDPAALCDVFAMLGHTRWTGELVVTGGDAQRAVFFEGANIVGVKTNVADERLGQVMYRFGVIDDAQIETLEAEIAKGARVGTAAVELGMCTQEQIYQLLGKQIEEVVFSCLSISDGTFFFLDGFDHDRLVSHHAIQADMLLMDLVTRLDEMRYFRAKIPGEDWVPVPMDRESPPDESYQKIFVAVDGRKSLAELARATGLGEFETTKAIYALAQSKYVSIHPPRMSGGVKGIVETANAALRLLHERIDEASKGYSFRASLSGFASGGGLYGVLFRGAGPAEDGTFDPDVLEANLDVAGDGEEEFLKEKLHEYVSFALFSAGGALGKRAEHELAQELEETLRLLQPQG